MLIVKMYDPFADENLGNFLSSIFEMSILLLIAAINNYPIMYALM